MAGNGNAVKITGTFTMIDGQRFELSEAWIGWLESWASNPANLGAALLPPGDNWPYIRAEIGGQKVVLYLSEATIKTMRSELAAQVESRPDARRMNDKEQALLRKLESGPRITPPPAPTIVIDENPYEGLIDDLELEFDEPDFGPEDTHPRTAINPDKSGKEISWRRAFAGAFVLIFGTAISFIIFLAAALLTYNDIASGIAFLASEAVTSVAAYLVWQPRRKTETQKPAPKAEKIMASKPKINIVESIGAFLLIAWILGSTAYVLIVTESLLATAVYFAVTVVLIFFADEIFDQRGNKGIGAAIVRGFSLGIWVAFLAILVISFTGRGAFYSDLREKGDSVGNAIEDAAWIMWNNAGLDSVYGKILGNQDTVVDTPIDTGNAAPSVAEPALPEPEPVEIAPEQPIPAEEPFNPFAPIPKSN